MNRLERWMTEEKYLVSLHHLVRPLFATKPKSYNKSMINMSNFSNYFEEKNHICLNRYEIRNLCEGTSKLSFVGCNCDGV